MASAADHIRTIAAPDTYPQDRMMGVLGVGDDGRTVILDAGNGKPVTAPCMRHYTDRSEGDQVLVRQLSRKNWLVLGTPGQVIDYITRAAVQDMIDDAVADIDIPKVPPKVTVTMSNGAPAGTGWQQAAVLPFVRDDGDGARAIHFQLAAPQTPSDPPTDPPPPTRTPRPVTISPNSHGSYRPGGQTDPGLIQGRWSGEAWTAALFYGSKIADACAGKTVDDMHITVARRDDGSGWNRGVPIHIGVHGRQTKGKVTSLTKVHTLGTLQRGQRKRFLLPAEIINGLKSGDDWGVGFGETSDYVKLTDGSGDIDITFS
jgi:ribosomal protein S6E (S10)